MVIDGGIAVIRENIASFLSDAASGKDLNTCRRSNFSVMSMKAVRGDLNIARGDADARAFTAAQRVMNVCDFE